MNCNSCRETTFQMSTVGFEAFLQWREMVCGHSDGTANLIHLSPRLSTTRPALIYCILTATVALVDEGGGTVLLTILTTIITGCKWNQMCFTVLTHHINLAQWWACHCVATVVTVKLHWILYGGVYCWLLVLQWVILITFGRETTREMHCALVCYSLQASTPLNRFSMCSCPFGETSNYYLSITKIMSKCSIQAQTVWIKT